MGALLRSEPVASDPSNPTCADPVRVMIVDDSLTVRTVFTRMIGLDTDMEIVATSNTAESGLSELASVTADVMLLDLEMPGMGGLEALPKIMEAAPETKVLVISSLTADGAEATVRAVSTTITSRPCWARSARSRALRPTRTPPPPLSRDSASRPRSSPSAPRPAGSMRSTCSSPRFRRISTCRSW